MSNGIIKIKDSELEYKFSIWIQDLEDIRKKRNSIVHSIILSNCEDSDDFRLYNYKKTKDGILREVLAFNTIDFIKVKDELVRINKEGGELLSELKR